MKSLARPAEQVPSWNLYGEDRAFPDVLHCELITDRAAGLDWIIAPHRHPHLHQFFLLRDGEIAMTADGNRYLPEAPCLVSIPRGSIHGFTFSAGTDGFVVTIPLQSLPDIFDQESPVSAPLSRFSIAPADRKIEDLFLALHKEHEARGIGRVPMLKALAAELACTVVRRLPSTSEIVLAGTDSRFRMFDELVQAHFRDGWQLQDYAEAVGVSVRHLNRLCRDTAGQTPTAYIESLTMREACRLLVYTRESIAAIGYQLGFDDPSYFSRAFRRHMGHSPREYRDLFEQE
jgi:AraC family transcriptional regulator, transcriptional activator of pobA